MQQADKGVLSQFLNGDLVQLCQPVVLRHDRHQRVLRQRDGSHPFGGRQGHKAQIDLSLPEPLLHVVVVAVEHFQLSLGVGALERPDHPWQPVDGHAGKGSQPDGSGVGTADVLHQLRQLPILLKNFLHFGQHHCPRLRQPDAAPVPAQKDEAVFLFQRA